jgi:hypothetical protein
MNTANNTHQPLTVDEANKLGGAMHDLAILSGKAIVEKDDAAKKRALLSYLQDSLLLHAEEFLAAWFTMEQEYKPMLQAQATVMGHVLTIIQRRQQIQVAQQTATNVSADVAHVAADAASDSVPENVVPLNP